MKQHAPQQENTLQDLLNRLARMICVLASFPLVAFHAMHDIRSKGDVIMRGMAVLIAPSVSAYFLYRHGQAIFAMAAFFLLLPVLSGLLDWRITASAYEPRAGQSLRPVRYGLALVTASIAFVGALAAERINLMRSLHEAEMHALAQGQSIHSPEFLAVQAQIAQARSVEAELVRKQDVEVPRLRQQIIRSRTLHEKECHGAGGVDAATGVQIKGGKCGPRAAAHKADMEAAERSLADLQLQIDAKVQTEERIKNLKARAQDIALHHLSPSENVGSLTKALTHASVGVYISVGLQFATVLFFELLCLIVAHIQPPVGVVQALALVEQLDQRRLEALQRKLSREMSRDEPTPRFDLSEDPRWSQSKSWTKGKGGRPDPPALAIGEQS